MDAEDVFRDPNQTTNVTALHQHSKILFHLKGVRVSSLREAGGMRSLTALSRLSAKVAMPCALPGLKPVTAIASTAEDALWEPAPDDDSLIPRYPPLNIKLRGHDFQVLQSF